MLLMKKMERAELKQQKNTVFIRILNERVRVTIMKVWCACSS